MTRSGGSSIATRGAGRALRSTMERVAHLSLSSELGVGGLDHPQWQRQQRSRATIVTGARDPAD